MPRNLISGVLGTLLLLLSACGPASNPVPPQAALALQAVTLPLQLTGGQTLQLVVTVDGQAAQNGQLVWTTGDANIVSISQGGLLTARNAGSTTVRAALAANPSLYLDLPVNIAAPNAPTPTPPAFAGRVLALTNAARAAGASCGGVTYAPTTPLTYNALLEKAAQAHASDMAAQDYFDHTSRDGRSVSDRINATGYAWRNIAENIAAGQLTPEEVVAGWLGSAGHCVNIMNPNLKELGVGYAQGGTLKHYWVQDFGTAR